MPAECGVVSLEIAKFEPSNNMLSNDKSMSFAASGALLDAGQPLLASTIDDDSDGPPTGRAGTVLGDAQT
jgi:hypothetical protein